MRFRSARPSRRNTGKIPRRAPMSRRFVRILPRARTLQLTLDAGSFGAGPAHFAVPVRTGLKRKRPVAGEPDGARGRAGRGGLERGEDACGHVLQASALLGLGDSAGERPIGRGPITADGARHVRGEAEILAAGSMARDIVLARGFK